jgi:hypothetical protein
VWTGDARDTLPKADIQPAAIGDGFPVADDVWLWGDCVELQNPVHWGQSFRRIADSVPVIADRI